MRRHNNTEEYDELLQAHSDGNSRQRENLPRLWATTHIHAGNILLHYYV